MNVVVQIKRHQAPPGELHVPPEPAAAQEQVSARAVTALLFCIGERINHRNLTELWNCKHFICTWGLDTFYDIWWINGTVSEIQPVTLILKSPVDTTWWFHEITKALILQNVFVLVLVYILLCITSKMPPPPLGFSLVWWRRSWRPSASLCWRTSTWCCSTYRHRHTLVPHTPPARKTRNSSTLTAPIPCCLTPWSSRWWSHVWWWCTVWRGEVSVSL